MDNSRKAGLGDRLRSAIKDGNITQSNLAERIGSTQAAVSQWCTGNKTPSRESIRAIEDTLGLRAGWLEDGQGPSRVVDEAAMRVAYRSTSFWGFRKAPKDGGRDFGNANVWSFDPTIDVLVREALQNARDAALSDASLVRVVFRVIELEGSDLSNYLEALQWQQLRDHLDASTKNRQKLGSLISDGLDNLDASGKLLLLVIEDSGTTGLIGPETGDGKFAALCRNNLDSNKEGVSTKGGAFGLGKGVLWRASRFATVVFCSNLAQPSEHGQNLRILGRCDLPWHEVGDEPFAGPSWFGQRSDDGELAVSFWDNPALASDLYLRREGIDSGASACVVGFHDPSSDSVRSARELADDIEVAAARHFFPALAFGNLAVTVETYSGRTEYETNSPSSSVEVDVERLQPEFSHVLSVFEEGGFVSELAKPGDVVCEKVSLRIPARKTDPKHAECEHAALLLVRYTPDEEATTQPNRLAMFRGPGMVVEERNLSGICLGSRPFHALLICGAAAGGDVCDLNADEFLRTAEPPSHNKWDATAELKAAYARGCVTTLRNFLNDAKDALRDIVKPASRDLGDGPNSLRELFRLGAEPISTTRDRPRIVGTPAGKVVDGKWHVEAQIRVKAADQEMAIVPAVMFVAETGGGQAVAWEKLEPVSNCTVDGNSLRVPARRRDVKFRGITDPLSHPVPAGESSIVVDIRKAYKLGASS